jgi:hypothetical protein
MNLVSKSRFSAEEIAKRRKNRVEKNRGQSTNLDRLAIVDGDVSGGSRRERIDDAVICGMDGVGVVRLLPRECYNWQGTELRRGETAPIAARRCSQLTTKSRRSDFWMMDWQRQLEL